MPQEFNGAMCVTVSEWESAGLSYDLYKNDKKRGYLTVIRRGGKERPALISLDSIVKSDRKAKIIEMFGDPRVAETKSLLVDRLTPDAKAVEFFSNFILEDGRHLPESKVDEYSANAMLLNAIGEIYTETIKARRRLGKGNNTRFWDNAAKAAVRIKGDTGHNLPRNSRSLHRTYMNYVNDSYISLISRRFCNDNSRKVDDRIISLLNNMFATQKFKPTYADIQRQYDGFLTGYVIVINNETGEQYNPTDFAKLSPATISNYLSGWNNKIANEAKRTGDRQVYMGKFKPYHALERPTYAGSIISIDDRQPPFEYAKGNRMWFYNGIDLASGAFTVSVIGKTKEGIILDFYRQMVRNYHQWGFNLPAELEAESSLNSSFKETFLKPGAMFEHVRIEANNARGKRIEQYFRQLRYDIEKKDENWIARPFAKAEANQVKGDKKVYIPYDKLAEQRIADIETWNNMPHTKGATITRWEYFVQNQNPNLKPTNYRGIIPYLGYKTETSCRVGRVKLRGGSYLLGMDSKILAGSGLINVMQQIEGEKISVYWLDANDGSMIKAYAYQGDRFVCELIPEPRYNRATIEQTDEDRAKRSIMSAYQLTIEGFAKKQKAKIDDVTVLDNTPVTLNNEFVMPGFNRERQEEMTPSADFELDNLDPIEEELTDVATGFQTALKDRF